MICEIYVPVRFSRYICFCRVKLVICLLNLNHPSLVSLQLFYINKTLLRHFLSITFIYMSNTSIDLHIPLIFDFTKIIVTSFVKCTSNLGLRKLHLSQSDTITILADVLITVITQYFIRNVQYLLFLIIETCNADVFV